MTDKLDAATIRDWLARIDSDWVSVEYFKALADHALELSAQLQSQAAELERLRKLSDRLQNDLRILTKGRIIQS